MLNTLSEGGNSGLQAGQSSTHTVSMETRCWKNKIWHCSIHASASILPSHIWKFSMLQTLTQPHAIKDAGFCPFSEPGWSISSHLVFSFFNATETWIQLTTEHMSTAFLSFWHELLVVCLHSIDIWFPPSILQFQVSFSGCNSGQRDFLRLHESFHNILHYKSWKTSVERVLCNLAWRNMISLELIGDLGQSG